MLVRSWSLIVLLACAAATACASTGAVPRPFPSPGPPAAESPIDAPAKTTGTDDGVVASALELQGVPYRNGGSDPAGFDCSGFVWYVFARHGVDVPRTVAAQFKAGSPVAARALRPGDLVFFDTGGSPVSHVGVVVDGDTFIHAPSSRGVVRTEHLSAPYWSSRFVGARRVT